MWEVARLLTTLCHRGEAAVGLYLAALLRRSTLALVHRHAPKGPQTWVPYGMLIPGRLYLAALPRRVVLNASVQGDSRGSERESHSPGARGPTLFDLRSGGITR